MLEAPSLPMGVSEAVEGRSTAFSLSAGDMVVLVSDGALADGADWLMEQLQLEARLHHTPDQVARTLADSAKRPCGGPAGRHHGGGAASLNKAAPFKFHAAAQYSPQRPV